MVDSSTKDLDECIKESKERLRITIVTKNQTEKNTKYRKQKWEEKQLYGYFER